MSKSTIRYAINVRKTLFAAGCAAILCLVSTLAQARSLPEFSELIEKNSPAVVKINTVERRSRVHNFRLPQQEQLPEIFRHLFENRPPHQHMIQNMGSGFIVSSDGFILTNHHVVEGADKIMVRLIDRREYPAEMIGGDERSDLALLKIKESNLPVLKLADNDDLKVGEWVLAIGSPFGLDYSASAGIVSAIGRSIPSERNENYVPFIQTDVAINPGNSGGPLFNLDGEVVGINSQIYTRSGGSIGLSFAIPVSLARDVMQQLKAKGRVDRGWLGVMIQEVDKNLADSFGLDKPQGALVVQLVEDAPAAKAGIKAGDIIVRFNGQRIDVAADLPHAVGRVSPGEKATVELIRKGKTRRLQVTVGTLVSGSERVVMSPGESDAGGRLGLVVDPLDEQLKNQWRLDGGVVVTSVLPDSPAARTGLRSGDVIVQLGYDDINSVAQFEKVAEGLPADTLQPIRFYRKGRPTFRTIVIDSN